MNIQELCIAANEALLKSVAQIRDDQWQLRLPEKFQYKPADLKDTIRYHTYDDAWVPDTLAGKSKAADGDPYEGLLTNDDVQNNYRLYNQRAIVAVQTLTDVTATTHLSYGDYSARDYLQHITSFRAFRSYDIARLIGADTVMDAEFVQALWDEFSPVMETYRQMGVFPPAVEVPTDADLQTRLLALAGRE